MRYLKGPNRKTIFAVLCLTMMTLTHNNCSEVSFETLSDAVEVIEESEITDTVTPDGQVISSYSVRVNFPEEAAGPVDLVWVIDNSGSMKEEAAHVRANFASFINYVKDRADLKLAVISQKGPSGASVELPFNSPNLLHIVRQVESTDGPRLLGSALCRVGPDMPQICRDLNVHFDNDLDGLLVNFLRPQARKTFIFVTDDESDLGNQAFLNLASAALPSQSVTVSGFVGLGRTETGGPSPCQEKTGVRYQAMAQATGGSIFNICDSDWTLSFNRLAQQAVFDATRPIPVPEEIRKAKILSVSLNGTVVSAQLWRITADGLVIDASLTKGLRNAVVAIEFTSNNTVVK